MGAKAKGVLAKGKKKAEKAAGFNDDEDDLASCFPKMSYSTRLKGFGVSFGLGVALNLLAMFWLWFTMFTGITTYAIFYSLGNICILGSGVFLTGLKRQFKMIMSYGRWICLLIYLGIMVFTIWYIMIREYPNIDSEDSQCDETESPSILIIIVLIIAQFLAGIWYMLSFIPYGRALAKKCLGKAVDT